MNLLTLNLLKNQFPTKNNLIIDRDIFPKNSEKNIFISDKYGVFSQASFSDDLIIQQGFKIHISATIDNYQAILDIVYQYCKQKKLDFKYISNTKLLEYSISSNALREESGKFITIYPYNNFKQIVKELYTHLKDFNGPYILSDKRYKNSNIYYRYGTFSKELNGYLITPEGKKILDKRTPYFDLPKFVKDPFPTKIDHAKIIGIKYKIKKAIMFKNSGGIYIGEDMDGNELVIKESRPFIEEFGVSATYYKKNEKKIMIEYENEFPYFAKYIDDFVEYGHFFLVESYIQGTTIEKLRSSKFIFGNNINTNQIELITTLIINILDAINKLHNKNVFVGDISDTNIIIDENNHVYFIDLEHTNNSVCSTEKPKILSKTRGFYDENFDKLSPFSQDNQQIGYLLLSFFTKSNFFLSIDPTGKSSINFFLKFCDEYNIPEVLINTVLELIMNPHTKLLNLLNNLRSNHKNLSFEINKDFSPANLNSIFKTLDLKFKNNDFFYSNPDLSLQWDRMYGHLSIEAVLENKICTLDDIICYKNIFREKDYIHNIQTQNFSLKNGLAEKYILLCKTNNSYKAKKEIEIILLKYLKQFTEQREIEFNLGLFEGILGIIYSLSFSDNSNEKLCIELKTTLDFIIQNYVDLKHFPWSMHIHTKSSVVSSYLSDGSSGLLKTLIQWSNNFKRKDFDTTIENIALSLINVKFTQCCTLDNGLAGIAESLLDTTSYLKTDRYLVHIGQIFEQIRYYIIKKDDLFYIPSKFFVSSGMDYAGGIAGIKSAYNRYIYYKNEERS